jgi:hypothetical protein
MLKADGEYVANIGVEKRTLTSVTNDHWTEVKIRNIHNTVAAQLLEKRGGAWVFKDSVKTDLANKYCLFINGYEDIRPWMNDEPAWKDTYGQEGGQDPGKISFLLCGQSLDDAAKECDVRERMQAFCKNPKGDLILTQTLHAKEDPRSAFAYVRLLPRPCCLMVTEACCHISLGAVGTDPS